MPNLGDVLPKDTVRYVDPEAEPGSTECIDVRPGTLLRARKDKTRTIRKVLRVDPQACAVRFDQGSDEANASTEARTKWERLVSFDTGFPFFDVVTEEEATAPPTKAKRSA